MAAGTVNRPLTLLRHLLRIAHEEWEAIDTVPRIKLEREPQGRLRWLTPEEATRLLEACRESRNPDLLDLVELSLFTGLRQGEAIGLTWDRVDRARRAVSWSPLSYRASVPQLQRRAEGDSELPGLGRMTSTR